MANGIIELQTILDKVYKAPDSRRQLAALLASMTDLLDQINERFSGEDDGGRNLQVKEDPSVIVNKSYYTDIIGADLTDSPAAEHSGEWNDSVKDILNDLLLITDEEESQYKIIANENPQSYGDNRVILLTEDGDHFEGAIKLPLDNKNKIYYNGEEYNLYYRIKDLQKADAGYSFNESDGLPWVVPFYNRIGSFYTQERADEILEALESSEHLKETCKKAKENMETYVNLLTDLYERQVEIEDLDRDFWVISQVISAIINFLFNNDGIIGLLEKMLKEIAQLWQNVIYLWSLLSKENQKDTLYLHKEIIYIGNGVNQDRQSKYDLGASQLSENNIVNILKLRAQEYVGCDLLLVPIIRLDYYEEDYHGTEEIPFLLYYNRKEKEFKKFYFKWDASAQETYKKGVIPDGSNKLVFTLKDNDSFDGFMHRYSDLEDQWEQHASDISGDYDLLKISCDFDSSNFLVKVQTIEPNNNPLGNRITHLIYATSILDKDFSELEDGAELNVTPSFQSGRITLSEDPINVSYYQGELLSRRREDEQVPITP